MYELNFDLLPEVKITSILKGITPTIVEPLENIGAFETVNRLKASAWFFSECSSAKEKWINEAYFRAGLSEFRSLNQAIKWDSYGKKKKGLTVENSKNPLVHLMHRLRRLSVYVAKPEFGNSETTVEPLSDESNFEHSFEVIVLNNIEMYLRKEKLDHYNDNDISKVCDWFSVTQRGFGASEVFRRGVECFAKEIIVDWNQF